MGLPVVTRQKSKVPLIADSIAGKKLRICTFLMMRIWSSSIPLCWTIKKILADKKENNMCEFENICIFEDSEECDKEHPHECPNWVIMMGEVMEG